MWPTVGINCKLNWCSFNAFLHIVGARCIIHSNVPVKKQDVTEASRHVAAC